MFSAFHKLVGTTAWAGVLVCTATTLSAAAEFNVDTNQVRHVTFVSDAPIESFEGTTDRIDGYVVIPADQLGHVSDFKTSEFYFEVDLGSLDTGIGLRNRHMRENYLETKEFPYATYAGKIDSASAVSDSSYIVYTTGDLTIHGVAQSRSLVDTVMVRGDSYSVRAHFPVALPDHDVEIPKLMFLKINEVVELHLSFAVKRVNESGQGD